MNKKSAFIILITILFLAGFVSLQLFSFPGGAPAGKSGSPSDGNTCISCHKATLKTQEGLITSNATNNLYEPGKKYTIRASAKGTAGVKRIGFEISPQNSMGTLLGTMILSDSDRTRLISKGKYITHTDQGSQAKDGANSWSFEWQAPKAGTGDVTFYGSFMVSESSQIVFTSTLTLKEKK